MINFAYLWDRIVLSAVGFREYAGVSIFPQAVEKTLATLESALTQAIKGAFATVANLFGGLVSFVAILVLTFYLTVQEDALKKNFYYFVPPSYLSLLTNLFGEIKRKISSWVRGQFILCFAVGLAVYLGLLILGVHYALLLGIFAGITEIIPYAGPFIGGAVAVFFALAQSPFKAFLVMILCILVQQLENNILVPKIMQKAVGLNPIITIIALLIGYRLAGIPGGLLAIPVAASLDLAFRTLLRKESPSS
jgi:predicted PurR-regulated permease PerM